MSDNRIEQLLGYAATETYGLKGVPPCMIGRQLRIVDPQIADPRGYVLARFSIAGLTRVGWVVRCSRRGRFIVE